MRADLQVVVALASGDKLPARVLDLSMGGMQLAAARAPSYGEALTLVVRASDATDWVLLPARVRWFGSRGFGVAFESIDARQREILARFVSGVAA